MNLLKKIYVLLICLFLFAACQKSPSASTVALSYYDLIINQNTSSIISLGMPQDTAQSITADIKENLYTQIKEKLSMNGLITVDDAAVTEIENAYLDALTRLNVTASETDDKKLRQVTLQTSYIDTKSIDESATKSALEDVDISDFTNETLYLETLTQAYIPYLIDGYKNALPSADVHEATFEFTLQNGMWLPTDYEHFVSSLCNLVGTSQDE